MKTGVVVKTVVLSGAGGVVDLVVEKTGVGCSEVVLPGVGLGLEVMTVVDIVGGLGWGMHGPQHSTLIW